MTYKNPVISVRGVDHGDPAVLKYNGVYYLYHTGGFEVPVYRSMNLVDWEECGVALRASEDRNHWAQIDLWAPEVIYENGTFYMYVTGAVKTEDGRANDHIRRIGVATSDSPLGPFILFPTPLTSEWSIDAHPFKDEDGTYYLFYNVRNEYTLGPGGYIGCGNVVDRMVSLTELSGNPTMVVKPEFLWEGNKDKTWFWNEGPFVVKRKGVYYQMYSAGHFADETYGVYYAASSVPMGNNGMNDQSWTKWQGGKAILQTNEYCLGPGHHVVVKGPNGMDDYVVYHGYEKGEHVRERRVRVGRMEWREDKIWIEPPSGDEIPVPKRPTFDGRGIHTIVELNDRLAHHSYESFLFETNFKRGDRDQDSFGLELSLKEGVDRVKWLVDLTNKSMTVLLEVKGETSSIHESVLPEEFNYLAYHPIKVTKKGSEVIFYLDQVPILTTNLVDLNPENKKGIGLKGTVRLTGGEAKYDLQGTLLQEIPNDVE
jgi:GH43 family beta-xylosidase